MELGAVFGKKISSPSPTPQISLRKQSSYWLQRWNEKKRIDSVTDCRIFNEDCGPSFYTKN